MHKLWHYIFILQVLEVRVRGTKLGGALSPKTLFSAQSALAGAAGGSNRSCFRSPIIPRFGAIPFIDGSN